MDFESEMMCSCFNSNWTY